MFAAVSSFFSCKTSKAPATPPAGFDWQGHRGCRGIMPENTVPAFLKALDYPEVTTLELDLAVSKDHQLIVSHEPWFNPVICRLPGGDSISRRDAEKYLIYQLTAEEIRGFDCGSWGNPRFPEQQKMKTYKPALREVVEAVRARRPDIRWNIEIKSLPEWDGLRHPPVEEFARLVIAELKTLRIEKKAIVQSFDVRALQAMHRQAPDIQLAFLIENVRGFDFNMNKLGFTPAVYSPYYQLVSKKLVRKCRTSGIKLIPWTVNEVSAMRGLIHLGVDGIITDYPNRIGAVGK
ncbi:MAG: glycerophosphodiester phosphodiesterase [Haliscomenobacteraceae bacterium CHB4]|nr:Glycerophosphodiester phosphodiesterase [Saprospiraceae bacterium]MCE7924928.1 glycerophosphodiester phosphodiesterase [Haliscomenobacteraceae bacterium CHB4]